MKPPPFHLPSTRTHLSHSPTCSALRSGLTLPTPSTRSEEWCSTETPRTTSQRSNSSPLPPHTWFQVRLKPRFTLPLCAVTKIQITNRNLCFLNSHPHPHNSTGIEPSPDKMLQARLFSYSDTHRHRLGKNLCPVTVRPLSVCVLRVT